MIVNQSEILSFQYRIFGVKFQEKETHLANMFHYIFIFYPTNLSSVGLEEKICFTRSLIMVRDVNKKKEGFLRGRKINLVGRTCIVFGV